MSTVDLSGLRRGAGAPRISRRPLGPRLLGLFALLLALSLVASFAWDRLFPPQLVPSARPRLAEGEGTRAARVVAEAAGWIEPDPFPIFVRPLVRGRIEELLVLEGHEVVAGETVIARLASAELLAAADRARSERDLQAARVAEAEAKVATASAALEQRGALRTALIRARRELATARERAAAAEARASAATADLAARNADLAGQRKLEAAGASFPVALARAEAEVEAAEARQAAAEHDRDALAAEVEQDRAALALAEELESDPRELRTAHAEAGAALARARAELARAETELAVAERELAWCEVRAPNDGVVLKLLAAPGMTAGPGGEGIVALYDRGRLQARVDVPLAMVAAVREGQEVEVRSEVTGSRITKGRVLRVQRESDLLKNTLQVKVALVDPDPLLRPETLCRARFVSSDEGGDEPAGEARWWVPTVAVHEGAVQVFDPSTGRSRRIGVTTLETRGAETLVGGDLSATLNVLLEQVAPGTRVRVEEGR